MLHPFWVDLHLHTVLSPCADLSMGALEIVERCNKEGVDMIAVTDHNHIGNYPALEAAARKKGKPVVLPGVEVQSLEDIHLVLVFPSKEIAEDFQAWLWLRMPPIENKNSIFGFQLVIDSENNITEEIPQLLIQGVGYSVDEIANYGIQTGSLVIPAHLDRRSFSYEAVLGRLPDFFPCSALELSSNVNHAEIEYWKKRYPGRMLIRSSDAHNLHEISRSRCTPMLLETLSFSEIVKALQNKEGRRVCFP